MKLGFEMADKGRRELEVQVEVRKIDRGAARATYLNDSMLVGFG
jgi:hypothetical protein